MEVSKVQLANGEVLVDLTNDSVTEETLAEGATAHDASGKKIIGTMKSGGASVQTDWDQMNETAPDFLKNKPFGDKYYPRTIFEDEELLFEYGAYALDISLFNLDESDYIIEFDGQTYQYANTIDSGSITFGNMSFLDDFFGSNNPNTGEPFCVLVIPEFEICMILTNDDGIHVVSITAIKVETKAIAERYVPVNSFYYHDDYLPYLYADSGLTIKATRDQVRNAVLNNTAHIVRLGFDNLVVSGTAAIAYSVQRVDTSWFEIGVFNVDNGSQPAFVHLYTAEYTEPTT